VRIVAPAEIRTCNFPIANPALYHTATSAPNGKSKQDKSSDANNSGLSSQNSNTFSLYALN